MDDLEKAQLVSLNEVMALSKAMTSRAIADFLLRQHLGSLENAGCSMNYCDCNNGYCSCKGTVSRTFDRQELVSLQDLEKLRRDKIEELKAQLAELERE